LRRAVHGERVQLEQRVSATNALRAFVPNKDFEASQPFYAELGLGRVLGPELAEGTFDEQSRLLQNCSRRRAHRFVMYALVADLNGRRAPIASLDLASRYAVESRKLLGA
jgi:hypothetical protein